MRFQGVIPIVKRGCIAVLILLLQVTFTFAQPLRVAVAANLQGVIKVLQEDFKRKTGINIEPIVGSSGKLVAQMKNGAPFDVFLSADMSFPESLYKDGLTTTRPHVYAYGSLVICSSKNIDLIRWQKLLPASGVGKVVIANPAVAPYGVAAKEVLQKAGIFNSIQPKLVYGESIGQVNTYITTGVVDVGFTTQALVNDPANKTKLYWKIIDHKTYTPISQGMVMLKRAEKNADAAKFYRYLISEDAKRIFKKYGYRL